MKKILFAAYSLDVGGIETALITLLKNLAKEYDITLVLERKQGLFLSEVPQNVKIITYKASNNKIVLFRKIANFIKQLLFKIKYKNKFDFAGCFATYSFPASFVSRTASKNACLWVHNDYMNFYDNNTIAYRKFFGDLKIYDFKKIIFVSDLDKKIFNTQFPEFKEKACVCNNLIDYNKIIMYADEEVDDFKKDENITTFINIGRHDEKQKKLSRIIKAAIKLKKEGYKFRVVFVGKGTATNKYKEMAEEVDNIEFLGAKKNPYPYLKNSDAFIMASEFEGYPVVFIESQILGKPIITTDVSDSKKDIDGKYGLVIEKSDKGVYDGMKEFLEKGYKLEKKFDPEKYNQDILKKLKNIIDRM